MNLIMFLNLRVLQSLSKWLGLNKQLIPFWKMFSWSSKFIISKFHSDLKFNGSIAKCLRHARLGLYLCYDKCMPTCMNWIEKNNFKLSRTTQQGELLETSIKVIQGLLVIQAKLLSIIIIMSCNKLHNSTNQAGAEIYS